MKLCCVIFVFACFQLANAEPPFSEFTIYQSIDDKYNKIPDVDLPKMPLVGAAKHFWRGLEHQDRTSPPSDARLIEVARGVCAKHEIVVVDIETYKDDANGTALEKARHTMQVLKQYAPNTLIGWYDGWGCDPGFGWRRKDAAIRDVRAKAVAYRDFDFIAVDIYNYYSQRGDQDYRKRMKWRLEQMKTIGVPLVVYVTPILPGEGRWSMLTDSQLRIERDLAIAYGDAMVLWAGCWDKNAPKMPSGSWQTLLTQLPRQRSSAERTPFPQAAE